MDVDLSCLMMILQKSYSGANVTSMLMRSILRFVSLTIPGADPTEVMHDNTHKDKKQFLSRKWNEINILYPSVTPTGAMRRWLGDEEVCQTSSNIGVWLLSRSWRRVSFVYSTVTSYSQLPPTGHNWDSLYCPSLLIWIRDNVDYYPIILDWVTRDQNLILKVSDFI